MWLVEKFRRFFTREQKGVVERYPQLWQAVGKPQPADYAKLYDYYRTHPLAKSSVDSLAGMIAGAGYYTTVHNPEDPQQARAKEIVDNFAAKVNLDELLLEVAKDLLITGNCFVEKIFEKRRLVGLKRLPVVEMRVVRDRFGNVQKYVQRPQAGQIEFSPRELVHFKWNDVKLTGYGIGILEPVQNYLEFDVKNTENMVEVIYKTAYPIPIFQFKSKADIDYFQELLKKRQPGEPILMLGEVSPNIIQVDSRIRFGEFLDAVERKIFEGMRAPLLSWLRNATEASAKVMLETVDRDVRAMQRYIRRKVEGEIFQPLLQGEGIRGVDVNFNWGMQRTGLEDLTIGDLISLAKADVAVLSRSQVINMLRMMGIPIPEPEGEKGVEEAWQVEKEYFPLSQCRVGTVRMHTEPSRAIRICQDKLTGEWRVQAVLKPKRGK